MCAQELAFQDTEQSNLEIYTMGQFLVKRGSELISGDVSRSQKPWEIFKYLITHRGKTFPPEQVLETLWPDQEYSDPNRALRNLVYRLRQILSEGCSREDRSIITFSQGGYSFNANADVWLDTEEFENLCRQAFSLRQEDPGGAIELYRKAVSLCRGEYLPECSYSEWVLPVRNHYRRIYLKACSDLTRLLKTTRRYPEIIEVCEKTFLVEPFEEEFHLSFMDALMEEGKTNQAKAHYEYVTSTFYRDMGVKPSPEMRNLYRRMRTDSDRVELDLSFIQDGLSERQETEGAFLCDPDVFRFLYKLEQRRGERSGQAVFLGLLTLTRPDYGMPMAKSLKETMERLKESLVTSLRKGDVVSRWNEAQYLVLLPGLSLEQAERVLGRIKERFRKGGGSKDIVLRAKLQSMLPKGT